MLLRNVSKLEYGVAIVNITEEWLDSVDEFRHSRTFYNLEDCVKQRLSSAIAKSHGKRTFNTEGLSVRLNGRLNDFFRYDKVKFPKNIQYVGQYLIVFCLNVKFKNAVLNDYQGIDESDELIRVLQGQSTDVKIQFIYTEEEWIQHSLTFFYDKLEESGLDINSNVMETIEERIS